MESITASSMQLIVNYNKRKKNELSTDDKKLLKYFMEDVKEALTLIKKETNISSTPIEFPKKGFDGARELIKKANKTYKDFKISFNEQSKRVLLKDLCTDQERVLLKDLCTNLVLISQYFDFLELGYWTKSP